MRTALLVACALAVTHAHAQPWTSHRPDGHAPIGVMADHTHSAGEVMLSYRYRLMDMAGSRDGTDGLDDAEIVAPDGYDFLITPTAMPMQMHMLGAMWAPTDALTLMGMVPFVSATMDHVSRMSLMADPDAVAFTTESGGLGDVTLAALYVLARPERQRVHAGLGVSLPTGSVEERDTTPMGEDQLLPYPMQTGSGTVDLRPSLTYLGQATAWSWGAQARAVVRLTDNTFEYRFGNVYAGTAWAARRLHEALSLSLRADAQTWGDVSNDLSGTNELPYESAVEGRVVPTVFPDLRGGTRLDLALGLNAEVPGGPLHGVRLAAEVGRPVYQSLDGPQLETDWVVTVGAQYAFAL